MGEFDEIAKEIERESKENNVGGSFSCFWCSERVTGAYYDYNDSILEWHCSNGHRSYIEDMEL